MTRALEFSRHLPLAIVLLLATILRIVGLGWGIPTPDYRHAPFHPDERWAMRNLAQINLRAGDINPEAAQGEGAFHYYLWILAAESLEALGIIEEVAWSKQLNKGEYGSILYIGRFLNVLYEAVSICLIYTILIKMVRRPNIALVGAGIFAVFPFEIIYSHFARTHVMANMFICIIIFLAFKLHDLEKVRTYILIGLVTGLAIASRWPTGFVFLIPLIVAIILSFKRLGSRRPSFRELVSTVILRTRIAYALPSMILGVLAGNPSVVLDYDSVRRYMSIMLSFTDTSQFSFVSLFNLDNLYKIFLYLIPYGALPFLWVLLYLGAAWSLACRSKLKYTVPLFCFLLAYLYLMGKGYPSKYVRLAMPSFPVFAILAALGLDEIMKTLEKWRALERCAWMAVVVILGATCLFSLDYVFAMNRPDPRVEMQRFIRDEDELSNRSVAVYPSGFLSSFITRPVFSGLGEKNIQPRKTAGNLIDVAPGEYLLIGDVQAQRDLIVNRVEQILKATLSEI